MALQSISLLTQKWMKDIGKLTCCHGCLFCKFSTRMEKEPATRYTEVVAGKCVFYGIQMLQRAQRPRVEMAHAVQVRAVLMHVPCRRCVSGSVVQHWC